MVTDAQLSAAIAADPFHQAAQHGHALDDFGAVADLLAQVFPSADAAPSEIWAAEVRA